MEEKILEFLKIYSGFKGFYIHLDYLPLKAGEICIKSENINPVLKTYADGSKLMQYGFSVCYKIPKTPSVKNTLRAKRLLEDFDLWLKAFTKEGNFPSCPDGIAFERLSDSITESGDLNSCVLSIRYKYIYYMRKE